MEPRWIKLQCVDSTNNWISEYLNREPDPVELAVVADFQESGRGQGDNAWVSREGENLLMSLLLFPAFLSAGNQFQLTRMASLALVDYLGSIGVESMIKWPNDIVTTSGKIAGILIELGVRGRNLTHSIIGIGLNLNQAEFPEFRIPATSVLLEAGNRVPTGEAAHGVVSRLLAKYGALSSGDSGELERAYQEKLYGLNRPISLEYRPIQLHLDPSGASHPSPGPTPWDPHGKPVGDTITGILRGVNESGELQLEMLDGTIQILNSGIVRMDSLRER